MEGGHPVIDLTGNERRAVGPALYYSAPSEALWSNRSPLRRAMLPNAAEPRIGMIRNTRARHNIGRQTPLVVPGCDHVMPQSLSELHEVIGQFVAKGVDTLIVDGGDGTVRDVVSVMARHHREYSPRIAIVPSGKTNALALDLGIPASWTPAQAIEAIVHGGSEQRAPIEISRKGADHVEQTGFIFGVGAYVRATQTAQRAHRFGAFNGLAVGLSIAAAVAQTLCGGANNPWRRGEIMRVTAEGAGAVEGPHYLVLISTLRRMPLDVRPFGRPRPGMKMLRIEAPAQRLARSLPALLGGLNRAGLAGDGYHRQDAGTVDLSLAGDFILDGETFPGGDLSLRQGALLSFVTP